MMKNKSNIIFAVLLILLISASSFYNCFNASVNRIFVDYIPSSFPVNFALYTSGNMQFVAYYDTSHQMIIAKRNLDSKIWDKQSLDSKVGWDSHNYLSIVIDNDGTIHLVGNMHSSPLIYFRSEKPYDIHSMKAIQSMTGKEEDITTYPEFMNGPAGELIFHYRYGISGSGYEVYNIWNYKTRQWERLLDKPLTDGQKLMNAYMQGPTLGPDGYYHLIWVWRDTPDCSTNHDLSYARSKDLVNWESVRGEKVDLPITIHYEQLIVDPTPIYKGLINIGIKIGFDADNKLLIGYHKYDSAGNTQLFLARYTNNKWINNQITNWDYRWDFKGYGTIKNELLIESPYATEQGEIIFGYHHIKYGNRQVVINNETLNYMRAEALTTIYPSEIDSVRSEIKGMVVNKVMDKGKTDKDFMLRWETLAPNRDKVQHINLKNSVLELIAY